MAAIVLPSDPWPSGVSFRPVRAGFDLPGTFGVDQRVSRMGDRWAMDVQMPPMPYGDTALRWVARLSRARGDVVRMRVPQPGLAVGDPGDVLVNGAGQSGTSLIVDGVNAPTSLREGQWVSITTGGRSYLHLIAADVLFDSAGEATLTLDPMLRVSPADNSPVEIEEPVIEGFLEAGQEWTVDVARHVGLSFTIRERR